MALTLKSSNALSTLATLSGPQWLELGSRYAPQVVAGAAVIGIAWQAARLTWLLLAPPAAIALQSVSLLPAPNSANQINVRRIADAHLFGVPGVNAAADPNSLPQTQMTLVLSGTMALDDPEAGFAIVGENAASAKLYRVGAIINGAVRLHSVYADRVIIERNGSLETLMLPRGVPSNGPLPMARNVVTTNSVGDNLRRIAANNPGALGELLRAQPVFSNGTQKGYRIYPGRDRQQFARLGLQPGDLVTSINGSTLDDPARGNEILNTLVASSTAQVIVERNGTSQTLSLDMAQISLPEAPEANSASSEGTPGTPQGLPRPLRGSPGVPPVGGPGSASAE